MKLHIIVVSVIATASLGLPRKTAVLEVMVQAREARRKKPKKASS